MSSKKKQTHNYTSELELKSLLIRIKNQRSEIGTERLNSRINKYVKLHSKIKGLKYEDNTKRNRLKQKLKDAVVRDSEKTSVDSKSYERFGTVILLMIKNILRKPQFSGYTYVDDFYSDASYKILKYLHNFDHTLISERTGQPVNSFAYISQYIHNSVIFIIITKKKENDRLKTQVRMENLNHNLQLNTMEIMKVPEYKMPKEALCDTVFLDELDDGQLTKELEDLQDYIAELDRLTVVYPNTYVISFDEFNAIKELTHGKVSIMRLDSYENEQERLQEKQAEQEEHND